MFRVSSDLAEQRIRERGVSMEHVRLTLQSPDVNRPQSPKSIRFRARRRFGAVTCEVDYLLSGDGVAEVYSARYVG